MEKEGGWKKRVDGKRGCRQQGTYPPTNKNNMRVSILEALQYYSSRGCDDLVFHWMHLPT